MSHLPKHLEKAERYLQKGNTKAALEEYLVAVQEDPHNDGICQTAAELCLTLHRNSEAAELLSRLLDRQVAAGNIASAANTYKRLRRAGGTKPEQHFCCAQLFERAGSTKEALDAYAAALRGFSEANRLSEALSTVEAMAAIEPTQERLCRQAELCASLGDKTRAVAAMLRAADLSRQNPLMTESDAGLELCRRAYALDPGNPAAVLAYSRALLAGYAASRAREDATAALEILQPLALSPNGTREIREAYVSALLALDCRVEAEPFVWEFFEADPSRVREVTEVIAALLEAGLVFKALELARKLERHQQRTGTRREYVGLMQELAEKQKPGIEFLEYLVELFNSANREQDYCASLIKLFELHYAGGNFLKCAECLDRAAEVDPYEAGHRDRLEMLRGKVDANRVRAIANRLQSVVDNTLGGSATTESDSQDESTVLEDLMLQAEIFLQYSMRPKAVERLERIQRLFAGEELSNEKLRELYSRAGLVPASPPSGEDASAPRLDSAIVPVMPPKAAARAAVDEDTMESIAKVTDITRNIYRQGNVKSVLFTAVNEAGRHWEASRCIAVLCSPGKPPSIALEYCAPGIQQSDVHTIVKLIAILQPLILAHGTLVISANRTPSALQPLKHFAGSMGIDSLIAVPLLEGTEHVGLLLLAQCNAPGAPLRDWRPTDMVVLKTIAEQTVQAVGNARLRSLVKNLAVTEEKSGLLKRSSYIDVLLSEVQRALAQNSPVTLMLMQFGRPGELTKEAGEAAVESMMQQIGQLVCSHIRQADLAIRYDVTTLALVLADTDDKHAFLALDKLRKVLANTRVSGTGAAPIITAGIAEAVLQPKYDAVDVVTEVLNRVETALEMALREGGTRAKSLAAALEASTTRV